MVLPPGNVALATVMLELVISFRRLVGKVANTLSANRAAVPLTPFGHTVAMATCVLEDVIIEFIVAVLVEFEIA